MSNFSQPVFAGVDLGHGWVKAATNVGKPFVFQSVAARRSDLPEIVTGQDSSSTVFIDGVPWAVGFSPDLVDSAQEIAVGAHFSDEHYALFLKALENIGCDIDVLIVGMTVDQAADKGKVSSLKERFRGVHATSKGEIFVDRVGAFPQPRGTGRLYLQSILNRVSNRSVLIVDIGEGTTDITRLFVTVNENKSVSLSSDRKTAMSEWMGVSTVSEAIAEEIHCDTPALISRAIKNGDTEYRVVDQEYDLERLIAKHGASVGRRLASAIRTKLRTFDNIHLVILTGGGANVLGDHITCHFDAKKVIKMPSPAMANANGFLLMAQDFGSERG